jgi:glycyl-tRNA synthetase beta chain
MQEGLPQDIADGIRDHYLPRDASDSLPPTYESAIVGIADRIDSIVGLFGIGKIPTGSADPLGLRRACLASISILIKRDFHLSIKDIIEKGIENYGGKLTDINQNELTSNILEFYLSRIKTLFQENPRPEIKGGYAYDTVESVIQADTIWYDLPDLRSRIQAMDEFRTTADFNNVATTFKRVSNILTNELEGVVDTSLFKDQEEQGLYYAAKDAESGIEQHLKNHEYLFALRAIGDLRKPVDKLFDAVMINDEDPAIRKNRHLLIQKVKQLVIKVADFSVIQE